MQDLQQEVPSQPAMLDFTESEAQQIAQSAVENGWQVAAHDCMRSLNHRAYRLAIDEYAAQIRFLLPLTSQSRVLQLRCSWGPVALNLATFAARRSWFGSIRRGTMTGGFSSRL